MKAKSLILLFGFVWLFCSLTVLLHASLIGKLTFNDYRSLAAACVAATFLSTFIAVVPALRRRAVRLSWRQRVILFSIGLGSFAVVRPDLQPYGAIAVSLGLVGPVVVDAIIGGDAGPRLSRREAIVLLIIGLIAAAITFVSHRADADDGGFLDILLSHLQHPDLPLFGFDASHGDVFSPFRFPPYSAVSYEILIATIASAIGIGPLEVYYGIVPPISAFVCVVALYALLREIAPKSAVLATAICFILIVAWGETHIAYGNRLFVRFFQGKGPLIGIAVPLCILAAIRFMRAPSGSHWVMLCASQIAALGFSSSGLIVGALAAAVGALAALIAGYGRNVRTCVTAAAASGYVVVVAIGMAINAPKGVGELGTVLPVAASLGEWPRTLLASAIGLLAIWMWRRGVAAFPAALVIACVALPLNPVVGLLFKTFVSQNMGWRIAWAAPVPLALSASLSIAIVSGVGPSRTKVERGFSVVAVCLLCAFLFVGRWTIAPGNDNLISFAMTKVPPAYEDARAVTAAAFHTAGTVLARDPIATWLPAQEGARARLVMAGHTYPLLMRFVWQPEEFERRHNLYEMISDHVALEPDLFLQQIKNLGVGLIVLDARSSGNAEIAKLLAGRGCTVSPLASGSPISLWRCREVLSMRGVPS